MLRKAHRDLKAAARAKAQPAVTLCRYILEEIGGVRTATGGPNKVRLRLVVIAAAGISPLALGRVKRSDLDLRAATVVVREARQRWPLPPRIQTLSRAGVAAFRAFAAGDAFGEADPRYLSVAWQTALTKAREDLLPASLAQCRPIESLWHLETRGPPCGDEALGPSSLR